MGGVTQYSFDSLLVREGSLICTIGCVVYAMQAKAYRSFNVNSVVEFSCGRIKLLTEES